MKFSLNFLYVALANYRAESLPAECEKCESTGYTIEKLTILGDQIKYHNNVGSWSNCAKICDNTSSCVAFAFQTKIKRCFVKSGTSGKPVGKDNFVYSRKCNLNSACYVEPETTTSLHHTQPG